MGVHHYLEIDSTTAVEKSETGESWKTLVST
jgi:hypothetical protein